MVRRSALLGLLLLPWLLPASGQAQVQTFYPLLAEGVDQAEQLCARRFAQPLVQSGGFRRSPDSDELVRTSACIGAVATPVSQRACELSMANIEVDYLVRFSH